MEASYGWKPTGTSWSTFTGRPASQPPPATPAPDSAAQDATLAEVAAGFIAAARDGTARNRSGRPYRPSALRDIASLLRNHVIPELGDLRLRDVQAEDLQRLVDDLAAGDLSLSRLRSVVSAIRALYAYALEREIVESSPASALEIARVDWTARDEYGYDKDSHYEGYDGPYGHDDDASSAGARWSRDRDDDGWHGDTRRRRDADDDDLSDAPPPGLIVSFALRALVAVFIIIALVSLVQALLIPA
jgi:hypothetical protein